MKQTHMAMIYISTDLMAGIPRLEKIIESLKTTGEIVGVSSIYKKYRNQRSEDLNSDLVLVVKLETEKVFEELFQVLDKTEQQQRLSTHSALLSLLTYDRLVRLYPGQNLPSPLLHTDPLTLRCASEVWGSFEHPVLGQTLNELVRSQKPLSHVEFFAQGKSLFQSESL